MDFLTKNTGLQHVAENIFLNLGYSDLVNCAEVSKNWKKDHGNTNYLVSKMPAEPKIFQQIGLEKIDSTNQSI